MLDKEVRVIKSKLSKVIYIELESSFASQGKNRNTKELITLLKALGESNAAIHNRILHSRSKFLKDFT